MSSRHATTFALLSIALTGLMSLPCHAGRPLDGTSATRKPAWTVDDLLSSPAPFALGHRGYGANDGEDPTRPLANSLDAFHQAFQDGIRVVELDLQQTADGKIVVFHDDYLEDFTCVASLTYEQLLVRRPQVPLFRAVLNSCRHFSTGDALSGMIFAEIKVPVPLCDGSNTSEQAAATEGPLVAAVVAEIRQARMEDQVILNSGSPTILKHVAVQAPEIKRALTLNALQLLPPAVVAQVLHMPVVQIPKNDFGLTWYNVGAIARLPALSSFNQFVGLSLAVGSRAVSLDRLFMAQAGANAPAAVAGLHGAGLKVIVWTVDTADEWASLARAGVDGITTNNIALGLANQAPLTASADGRAARTMGSAPIAGIETPAPALALEAVGGNPARDGAVHVEFALPRRGAARLEMVDITGRMIDAGDVESFGPGRHSYSLGRDLRPGMYLVRLTQGTDQARVKVAVTR